MQDVRVGEKGGPKEQLRETRPLLKDAAKRAKCEYEAKKSPRSPRLTDSERDLPRRFGRYQMELLELERLSRDTCKR